MPAKLIHTLSYAMAADIIPLAGFAEVQQRVEAALGGGLVEPIDVHHVRDVAPNKVMLCVTFQIPKHVLFKNGIQHSSPEQPQKRQKCESECDHQ